MNNFYSNIHDTIAAISTPIGKGAISIIRLSGPRTFYILNKISRHGLKKNKIKMGKIFVKTIMHNNKIIDHVVVIAHIKPKSYTGEDLIEIQCHGNPIITNIILNLIFSNGARMANPGEFTLRAFLNNKIDLIQAEAVNDLINANNFSSMELAMDYLNGKLSDKIMFIDNLLKQLLINVEVIIDHSEDDHLFIKLKEIKKTVNNIIKEIDQLIKSYEFGLKIKKGINISIVGKANVGKSSLFNLLIKRDKAIISPKPGTTRDVIEEYIELNGCPIKINDTAGIKNTTNDIEIEALKRTLNSIKEANILLVMFDNSSKLNTHDFKLIKLLSKNSIFKVIIINKYDLNSRIDLNQIKKIFSTEKVLKISVSRETGIKKLEETIVEFIEKYDIKEKLIINNIRHKNILMDVKRYLYNVLKSIENNYFYDLICIDLRKAVNELGSLTGKYTSEIMLEEIFSNFCIGK